MNSKHRKSIAVIVAHPDDETFSSGGTIAKLVHNKHNGLIKDSSADCFQIRSVSETRFVKKLGHVDESLMDEIRSGLSKVLSISEE